MVEGGKERRGEGGRGEEDRGTLNNLPPSEASLPQQAAAIPRTPHVSLTFAPLCLTCPPHALTRPTVLTHPPPFVSPCPQC